MQSRPVPRRHAKKLRASCHEVVLEFVQDAVGQHDLPQHLNDALPSFLIEFAAKHAGEAVKVDCLMFPGLRFSNDTPKLRLIEIEALLHQVLEFAPLLGIDMSVDPRCMHKQRRGRELQFLFAQGLGPADPRQAAGR